LLSFESMTWQNPFGGRAPTNPLKGELTAVTLLDFRELLREDGAGKKRGERRREKKKGKELNGKAEYCID